MYVLVVYILFLNLKKVVLTVDSIIISSNVKSLSVSLFIRAYVSESKIFFVQIN